VKHFKLIAVNNGVGLRMIHYAQEWGVFRSRDLLNFGK